MSSEGARARPRSRRAALAAAGAAAALPALAAGGCNLRPLYGGTEGAAVAAELAAIDVRTQQLRLAQEVGTRLGEALNPAGLAVPPGYELLVEVELFETDLAIQLQGATTRRDLYLLASYLLRRKGEERPLASSAVRGVASYNVPLQPFAEVAARRDAERRAAEEVAQLVRTRLSIYFRGRGGDPGGAADPGAAAG